MIIYVANYFKCEICKGNTKNQINKWKHYYSDKNEIYFD